MAKDGNTFEKNIREREKKRKADEKRQRRAKKKQQRRESSLGDSTQPALSAGEHSVLEVFRTYLMTPGNMLCIGSSDLDTFARPLARLVDRGLLVAEQRHGGYSLTESGFAAMKHSA